MSYYLVTKSNRNIIKSQDYIKVFSNLQSATHKLNELDNNYSITSLKLERIYMGAVGNKVTVIYGDHIKINIQL